MTAKWTVAQDGRHAVELEPKDSGFIAVYRFLSPVGRARYYIDVTTQRAAEGRYHVTVTVSTPMFSFARVPETLRTAFHAIDDSAAAAVLRGLAKAWATGRIPLLPASRAQTMTWRLYIDATADAITRRRTRALDQ